MKETNDSRPPALELELEVEAETASLGPWMPLLTGGVEVEAELGCNVRDLLCRLLDVDAEYLDRNVQTVFLSGRAVDDLDRTFAAPGDTLALSSAMPGLAGATLRRGGALSGMRSAISHAGSGSCGGRTEGRITVKLFNLVARDLGANLLSRGVLAPGPAVAGALSAAAGRVLLDGRPAASGEAADRLQAAATCRLRVSMPSGALSFS